MATTYTAEVAINCQKEHTCAGRGAVYSYPFVRKIRGSSTTSTQAARRQAATPSKNLILLRVDTDAGRGIGSSKKQRDLITADQAALFLLIAGKCAM